MIPICTYLKQRYFHLLCFFAHFPLFRCPPGYVGEYCQHPDPCRTGDQKCQNGGTCTVVQLPGQAPSFQCACPVGFKNSLCETPVSNVCNSSPCQNGGTCHLSTLSSYTCTCPRGWQGRHCTEPDNCATNPCRNGANCTSLPDRPNAYRCTCREGYIGPDCNINVNECDELNGKPNPCQHGKCVDTYGGYK